MINLALVVANHVGFTATLCSRPRKCSKQEGYTTAIITEKKMHLLSKEDYDAHGSD